MGASDAEKVEEARRRFLKELEIQEEQRAKRPRERGLPRDEARVSLAVEKVMAEALRLIRTGAIAYTEVNPGATRAAHTFIGERDESIVESQQMLLVEVEVAVKSRDGLLYGRIDQAEHRPEGVHLLDYKSALRTDLLERYERQLQLYALLWYETRDEWPKSAEVVYLLSGSTYPISVEPEACQRVGSESNALISRLQKVS